MKIGPIANAPSKAVKCGNVTGALVEIPLASIQTAVQLVQAGPLEAGDNAVRFSHVFGNREGVNVAAACAGTTLEEQAVGPDMSTFQNIPAVFSSFNQFRMLITTPDATTGATTFCGVVCLSGLGNDEYQLMLSVDGTREVHGGMICVTQEEGSCRTSERSSWRATCKFLSQTTRIWIKKRCFGERSERIGRCCICSFRFDPSGSVSRNLLLPSSATSPRSLKPLSCVNSASTIHVTCIFDELPPELIALLPASLTTAALNALVLTCRHLREILQPELESRLTPKLSEKLFPWAAAPYPSQASLPPHSLGPGAGYLLYAAEVGNIESTALLLKAGADPAMDWDQEQHQALHLATMNKDLDMIKLLLDHGAPVDAQFGSDGGSQSALHYACSIGPMEMILLLLRRGADLQRRGYFGAGQRCKSNGPASTPPETEERGGVVKWDGLPLGAETKQLISLLMAASQETALGTISTHLTALVKEASIRRRNVLLQF
ncbi:hypothetical protein B0H17DRAFT_1129946 [Mycena rosella]|uniref:Uncharacterized protein n=1 Tax=Mycena rosella TaxID=1033263 RepID=A0AAD7GPK4_MYCRO|nr:hypothetical protein B0H17DRAFT_1129946 [Mycena rosella]